MKGNKPQHPLHKHYWSPHDKNPGYIYVIELCINDLYKIGFSKKPERRLIDLKSANPFAKMIYKAQVGHAKRTEHELHTKFEDKHHSKELYHLDQSDLNWICNYVNTIQRDYLRTHNR